VTTLQLKCVRHLGAELPPARGSFYSARTRFDVVPATVYTTVALGIFESTILALVIDETGKPNWLPAGLFDMSSLPLPSNWNFRVLDALATAGGEITDRWIAVWAPPGLVDTPAQIAAVVERDEAAVAAVIDYARSTEP
jgi:hypothetical protein